MEKRTTTPSTRKRTSRKTDAGITELAVDNRQLGPNGTEPTEDEIRLRAYHRYLERGASHGGDFDDWLEAERDLKSHRHN